MSDQEISTVAYVDLKRYLGIWYEIARLPLKWEDATARDITAHYSLQENGKIQVDNRCIDEDGLYSQSIGEAEAIDASNSKLTVTFLPEYLRWVPFTKGDYWVLALDPEYQISLVGTPNRENLWLLSRTPQLDESIKESYLLRARSMGFDLAGLIMPQQSGRVVPDEAFEN